MSQLTVVFLLVIPAINVWCFVADNAVPSVDTLSSMKPVECYECVNCPQVGNQTNKQRCPYNHDHAKVKKCVMYSEKHPYIKRKGDMSWVIRGCASARGSCADIRKAYAGNSPDLANLEYCQECEGDLCNRVSRTLPGMVFAFFAVVLTPILARYTFS